MKTKKDILDYLDLRLMTLCLISNNLCDLLKNEKDVEKFSKLSNELNIVLIKLRLLNSIVNYINEKEDK